MTKNTVLCRQHVGYFLVDDGRPVLEHFVEMRLPPGTAIDKIRRMFPLSLYLGTALVLTLAGLWILWHLTEQPSLSRLLMAALAMPMATPHALAGVWLQRQYEQRAFELGRGEYRCPIQRADDFLHDRPTATAPASSYLRGVVPAHIAELVPTEVIMALRRALPAFDARWRGRFLRDATLVGPEARGSSPLRITRDPVTLESPAVGGLYPVGEGAGYAGGIVSAALDGLRAAKAIIARFAPLEIN